MIRHTVGSIVSRKGFSIFLILRSLATIAASSSSNVDKGLCIRLARRDDIPSIRQCNLQSLPENYSDQFYLRHLNTWPGLTIVAENDEALLGYAIGRIELTSRTANSQQRSLTTTGHVASIAVSNNHRGKGIAKSLMTKLHTQFAHLHNVDNVQLHVRCSNTAAIKLYSEAFPYRCVDRVPKYYEDGEDAWIMSLSGLLRMERAGTGAAAAAQSVSREQLVFDDISYTAN